jgi:hypothetical protein
MPHDPHLTDLMRTVVKRRRGFSERRMFGTYCWLYEGNMVCGVGIGRYMFRVGKELQPQALTRPGATALEFSGKPMGGFVWVDADAALDAGLDSWIDFAMQFVGSLPPK